MNQLRRLFTAIFAVVAFLVAAASCCMAQNTSSAQVPDHYTYQHAFNYDLNGAHLDVYETGTMDFYPDGTALDSARQVYTATLQNGKKVTYVFNYVSPSKWRLEGEDFYFAGVKESFRMEVVEGDKEDELTQEIIKAVSGSIDYEYKFHLDTLTEKKLQWSFTYRDGHRDTWEFYRIKE